MKIVFISGPLTTGGDGSREYKANNIQAAERYSVVLANAGISFFCAHSHASFHHEKRSPAACSFRAEPSKKVFFSFYPHTKVWCGGLEEKEIARKIKNVKKTFLRGGER